VETAVEFGGKANIRGQEKKKEREPMKSKRINSSYVEISCLNIAKRDARLEGRNQKNK